MMGQIFRNDFLAMLDQMGEAVTVYRDFGTPSQTATKVAKSLLGSDDHGRSDSVFSFADPLDIKAGDIIKPDATRDHYRVTDTTDHTEGGVFIEFAVNVVKAGATPVAQPVSVTNNFHTTNHAPVYGQQIASTHSALNVTVNAQLNQAFGELRSAVADSDLAPSTKRTPSTL